MPLRTAFHVASRVLAETRDVQAGLAVPWHTEPRLYALLLSPHTPYLLQQYGLSSWRTIDYVVWIQRCPYTEPPIQPHTRR